MKDDGLERYDDSTGAEEVPMIRNVLLLFLLIFASIAFIGILSILINL